MGLKCLAQEHNTMSPARARTRTARSGGERTNHEATVPPHFLKRHGTFIAEGQLYWSLKSYSGVAKSMSKKLLNNNFMSNQLKLI